MLHRRRPLCRVQASRREEAQRDYHRFVLKGSTGDSAELTIEESWDSWRSEVPPITGRLGVLGLALLVLDAVAGVLLRWTPSKPLWLDEALTVSIAKLPLGSLHQALKEDGAPPLYYVILHAWIWVFGSSAVAVRSLSLVFSLATVGVLYCLVKRIWGREVALFSIALLLASSFGAYYATETRMYALVMLWCALGGFFLAWLFEKPSAKRMLPLALVLVAMEYTHYWTLYFLAMLGAWLLFCAVKGPEARVRLAGRWGIGGLALAGLAFTPWLPTFLWQSKHTGTPWGGAPNFTTVVVATFHFNYNQMAQVPRSGVVQRIAELLMILAFFGALFVVATGSRKIRFAWKGLPRARFLGWMSIGVIVLGVVASHFTKAAFAPRYASIAYIPLLIFLAVGTRALWSPILRIVLIGGLCLCTLVVGYQQSSTARSQAPDVARVLNAAPAGSVVVFCPDQLGPSTMRLLTNKNLKVFGYPHFDDPNFVNWVDYNQALFSSNPKEALARLLVEANGHPIYLDTAAGYAQAGPTCTALRVQLSAWLPQQTRVHGDNKRYYQSMTLIEFSTANAVIPRGSP